MKITFALLFPLIAAVVATPAPTPDDSVLDSRASINPGCTWVVNCGGLGDCEAFPCIDDGYSCDGPGIPTSAPGGTVNATCTTACSCEFFCGPGPVCLP
ncbi:hypothetical protein B0H13DRAFT_1969910 [Mycena leptocephala]|nr:hypothetical protein B0H13DRAFT_1969910 [Mycena leptocephala]